MRKFAEEEAIVEAVLDYKRALEGQARDNLLNLLQRVNYVESGMLPDTDTYCVRVEGYVTPIEAVALLQSAPKQESPEQAISTYDDEFDGPTLNPNWYWLKEDPSRWRLDTTPGKLQIVATGGEIINTCNDPNNILLQPAPTGDFELETGISMRPTRSYQQGGLIILMIPIIG